MPSTPAATPATIARAALRRLAEQGLEPTPENYRDAYLAASPATAAAAPARPSPAPARAPLESAAREFGPALARFVREWERSQAGLSRVQKLQTLQQIETSGQALQVLELLRATNERWSALRERTPPAPMVAASATPSGTAAPQHGSWKRLWLDAVRMAEQAYTAQPDIQAQARELLSAAAELDELGAGFTLQAQALWDACEQWHATEARAGSGTLEAMRLLLDNLGELFDPTHWIQAQIAALHEVLRAPTQLPRLEQAVAGLKDLLLRQGVLRKSGDDARRLARELIDMVVRSLGNYVENTERYGERLRAGMRELDESGDWQRAKSVVQGILAQSQQMLEQSSQLRLSFADAQQQLHSARERTRALEGEIEQLSELIQQDPLTGALNRRGLELCFRREVSRAERGGEALSLAMVDLDLFKAINDNYGHDLGDAVLRELVQVLRGELRPTDVVARMGGEEFLVLLPGQDEQGACNALQRARQVFSARRFPHPRQRDGVRSSFSAGVARWVPGESLDEAYARADQALLQAKQGGRDRVEIAPQPEPQA